MRLVPPRLPGAMPTFQLAFSDSALPPERRLIAPGPSIARRRPIKSLAPIPHSPIRAATVREWLANEATTSHTFTRRPIDNRALTPMEAHR
jgi:hypothetical protein